MMNPDNSSQDGFRQTNSNRENKPLMIMGGPACSKVCKAEPIK